MRGSCGKYGRAAGQRGLAARSRMAGISAAIISIPVMAKAAG
jgi:hypothetical protein